MILNNKLLRILPNAPRDTPVVKLYYVSFNTLTLRELHTYQILQFVHNCIFLLKQTAIHIFRLLSPELYDPCT